MPTTPRKSSLGGTSRRGPLKAHIPYRGDNPEVGKKTGIAVQHVARQSDGFEPFEQILQQADGRTPPRPKGRKKSFSASAHQDENEHSSDDGWEESMQLDSMYLFFLSFLFISNTTTGPIHNLANARPAVSPAKSNRSSFRPVARTSDIDFDKIPSPRPNSSSRKSTARNSVAGPSSPSKYTRSFQPEPNSGSPDQDDGMGPDPFDDYAPQENRSPGKVSPRKTSFRGIEQEEDDDMGGQEEEEPLQDLEPILEQEEDDDNAVQEEIGKKKRKPRQDLASRLEQEEDDNKGVQEEKKKKKRKPLQELSPRLGVRRSKREHYKPLEYWRGEKLVYGRTSRSGPILVPQIKEIIRIPKEESVPLGIAGKRKRGSTRARSRSKATEPVEGVIPPALPVVDPEEGWDDDTEAKCTVIHFTSREEVERR